MEQQGALSDGDPTDRGRLVLRRTAEMAAVFMIGDGLLGLLQPRRHVDLWKDRALGAEIVVAPFVGHPRRRRLYALAQIAAGLALAGRQRA
jgi:hypothetical protein